MKNKVNILGTEYKIIVRKYKKDKVFKYYGASGYCSSTRHEIVICDMNTFPGWKYEDKLVQEEQTKETLRHEIVHGFLEESGLSTNSIESDCWARNEEMVDWIAKQGPKIYKAWKEAEAL